MSYECDELEGRIHSIFNPEPVVGNEGAEWHERPPSSRLAAEYGLDTTYWESFEYGSTSPLVRRAVIDDSGLANVVRAQQVPREMFLGTLRLFGNAIVAYHDDTERLGPYRFYPAILMSAWASFEAFVRVYSELLVKTVPGIPDLARQRLLEQEQSLDDKGKIQVRHRMQPLLQRFWWLLKFGYGLEYARGGRIWQMGEAALDKRNELVHYEVSDMPSLKATKLWQYLEAILLLLIGPSARLGKSIMPDQYELYGLLVDLQPLVEEYEERPFFKGMPLRLTSVAFPCPFQNVDDEKFPTWGA